MIKRIARGTWLTLCAVVMSATPGLAQDAASPAAMETLHQYDIPAGPLGTALTRLTDQSGMALVYPTSLTDGLTTEGFSGSATIETALARLLAGTKLTFRRINDTTITIETRPGLGERVLGPVEVEGAQKTAGANGSTDATATEGTGSLTSGSATVASKIPRSLKETPQTVTVMTSERIEQQNLLDFTAVLSYTPGLTTMYIDNGAVLPVPLSRGFLVNNFQFDGGAPLQFPTVTVYGPSSNFNLAEFDHVELLRGSGGMFGGSGLTPPSGVLNLARKRPLDHDQFTFDGRAGSWNNYNGEIDVTGPIGFGDRLRGRLVADVHDQDYFYGAQHSYEYFLYGVVEADLPANFLLRLGASYDRDDVSGFNQSGFSRFADGSDLHLPRSACLCADWAYFRSWNLELFANLEHNFSDNLAWRAGVTHLMQSTDTLYNSNTNNGTITPAGFGQQETTYWVWGRDNQNAVDTSLTGSFSLLGLDQKFVVGADYVHTNAIWYYNGTATTFLPVSIFAFTPAVLNPEPPLGAFMYNGPVTQTQWGGFAQVDLQPLEGFHILAGGRLSYFRSTQTSAYFGPYASLGTTVADFRDYRVFTPTIGVTYDLTSLVTLYASYADVYQSQSTLLDHAHKALEPISGETYEVGAKANPRDGKLNVSVAFYYTQETNVGLVDPTSMAAQGLGNCCYFNNGLVTSKGIDLEMSGELLPGWQLQAGYNYNFNRQNGGAGALTVGFGIGNNGQNYNPQQPRHQFKLWTSYALSGPLDGVTLGAGLRVESDRYSVGTICSAAVDQSGNCPTSIFVPFDVRQKLYSLIDLRVAYRLDEHLEAAVNVTNVADTSYYAALHTPQYQNFYGEPRAVMFSLHVKY